ncbi:MAG: acetyltransferase [Chloroflexales bacterium]|nr:acetyltransferase [Chloroflexales bacterium]
MQRVLILGAGGHAQVVADILMRASDAGASVEPLGYLDDNPHLTDQRFLGLPVLGRMVDLGRVAHDALVIAIGDNATRRKLFASLQAQGEHFAVARHPSAIIAPDAQIGPGVMICAGVIINSGCIIGANAILNTGCTIDHHNRIGDHTHIAPGVHLGGEVQIGEGGFVGIGAIVMPQRRVGSWSVVGAGAVVHRDIPADVVAVGVPARVIEPIQSAS